MILRPVPPFRLDLTVWAVRRRARNAIDRWDGTTFRRVVVLGHRPTELAVRQEGPSITPRSIVTATRHRRPMREVSPRKERSIARFGAVHIGAREMAFTTGS